LALSPSGDVLTGWTRLYRDDAGSIWSNPLLLSEARVVGRVVTVPRNPEVIERIIRDFDFEEGALVEHSVPSLSARRMNLLVENRTPTRLEANVSCDGPCMLVVAQAWAPGWAAFVDQVELPIIRTNIAGIGVRIPAGKHDVQLLYRPWRWWGRLH
jgi:hypothetical protein